ncbi:hypothetical protein [Hymenobacter yonginensis]|uniref:Lipoprotein n=1 Tax=Hymenobacter yonginensis TaxID=748197 RepID=A0ABY7PSY7_9BACT|nr:hypothetical protein [Hymenobacter yonginensis]WBO86022.1 hypothetical protein O9Z63_07150 [Hymenobacter yonginensis]
MQRSCLLLPLLLLAGCSAPTDSAGSYPQNPAISDAQGHPRDSTTFYFPAADSLPATYVSKSKRPTSYVIDESVMNCTDEMKYASYALTYFKAPVLSNYYLGTDTYRFLWLRSFHLPVLLTLSANEEGASLRTQVLDKKPGFHMLTVQHPDSLSPTVTAGERTRAQKYYTQTMADPEFIRSVAEGKRRAQLIDSADTVLPVTHQQLQHFRQLLAQYQFQRTSACQPVLMLDGAYWLLEAHQASGYNMVARRSPDETDGFHKACEYLLDLSSARGEERY